MEYSLIWLVKLLLAHLVSDFWLQPNSWVQDRMLYKIRSKYLYYHILVTLFIAFLALGSNYWEMVTVLAILHLLIDIWKSYRPATFLYFLIDQGLHLLTILACWAVEFNKFPEFEQLINFYENSTLWLWFAGIFFLTIPSSIFIGQATKKWNVAPGLVNAGKYIGMIERILICILVYHGQYEAIGLLITGKSILRYNSSNEEVKTEYLLVGTLLSIFLAFVVGLLLKSTL